MLIDLEVQLAKVLAELPDDLNGSVHAAPGSATGNQLRAVVGVVTSTPTISEMGVTSRPGRVVPGKDDPRKVLSLRCTIHVEVFAAGTDRANQRKAVDSLLYALEDEDMRSGKALTESGKDLLFLVRRLRVDRSEVPLRADSKFPARIVLTADGWFWPADLEGKAGTKIIDVRVRGVQARVEVTAAGRLVAGGSAVALRVGVQRVAAMRLTDPVAAHPAPPLTLFLALRSLQGEPGAGSLSGGAAGTQDNRVVPLVGDSASVSYTPPAAAGVDILHVGLADGSGGLRVPLQRVPLVVEAP